MKYSTLIEAISETKRFLKRAETLDKAYKLGAQTWDHMDMNPKEQGAVQRASMDLTRLLAELRDGR